MSGGAKKQVFAGNRTALRPVDGWRWGRWDPPAVGVAAVALLVGLACAPGPPEPRPGAPNLVILVSDDQDYEHFSFAGHPIANTPTLDALAASGQRFDNVFVPVARCRPAQAALLSGQWPHQSGVYYNVGADHIDPRTSVANLLDAAGYRSFGEGKFWEYDPRLMGFESYTIRNHDTFARLGQEHLFEWLRALDRERPFFLWWAPKLPHTPHDPPARFLDAIDPATIEVPDYVLPAYHEEYVEAERLSLAMVAWLDEAVRELMDELESLGELDETMFLFLVDNGWANGLPSKGTPYDKGLKTPAILTLPGVIPAGGVHSELVSAVDLYATLLDYGGARVPASCQGESLRPWIEGAEDAFRGRDTLFGAAYPYTPREPAADATRDAFALWARTPELKYVLYLSDVRRSDDRILRLQAIACPYPERSRGDEELFDLSRDPYELENLAGDPRRRAEMDRLRAEMLAWWSETGGGELSLP